VLFIRRHELPFLGAVLSKEAGERIDASLKSRAGY
jgi:hypothetical protein